MYFSEPQNFAESSNPAHASNRFLHRLQFTTFTLQPPDSIKSSNIFIMKFIPRQN